MIKLTTKISSTFCGIYGSTRNLRWGEFCVFKEQQEGHHSKVIKMNSTRNKLREIMEGWVISGLVGHFMNLNF